MIVDEINPHGFCAGVSAALGKAEALAAGAGGRPVYCLHELVHNEIVIAGLKALGFVFVDDIADVPPGEAVLFSAHGVSPAVREAAIRRGLRIEDATCPFVSRVHKAAAAFARRGLPFAVIGRRDHAETRGILGEAGPAGAFMFDEIPPDAGRFGIVSQTTMNADEVEEVVAKLSREYDVAGTAEVCRATKERQDAVKSFDGDAVLVLGSASSSNTKRLCEVAKCKAFRAGTMEEALSFDYSGIARLGVTSGASTPESLYRETVARLRQTFANS